MSFDTITRNVSSANAGSIGDGLSAVASKMAFHILYESTDAALNIRIRLPYVNKSKPYNQDTDFMAHESRQFLDYQVPEGFRYGIVTFEASGKDGGPKMVDHVRFLRKQGWTTPDGERFRFVYGHINGDKGLLLLVSAAAKVRDLSQLGLVLTSGVKTPKRVQRIFASYQTLHKCRLLTSYTEDNGTVYEAMLPDGKLFRTLNFNMELLTPEMQAFLDGSGHCGLPGFDGCAFTMLGSWGSNKGVYAKNLLLQDYDVVNYGEQKEVALTNGFVFIGVLSKTGLYDLTMDPQTLLNSGGYEDELCIKYGENAMNKMAGLLFSDDEDALVEHFSKLVNVSDAARRKVSEPKIEWSLIKAMKDDHQSKTMPVLFRRMVNHGMRMAVDVVRGRVAMGEIGCRLYVRPYPNMLEANGTPDVKLDNLSGKHEGLPIVCMPDVKKGPAMLGRNPNTNSSEMILVWNIHLPELVQFKGEGWCFMGSDAGELLNPLNGGDMDDNVFVITDPAYIAKWQTMKYPVQPKIKVADRQVPADVAAYRAHYMGIGEFWSANVFEEQLKAFVEYSDSLGSFINDGMLDSSLSGEHRASIKACLENGTFVAPENFIAPSRKELENILLKTLWKFIPVDYEPTADHFIRLCKVMIEHKPDFICARAMSNSDLVIDMLQQGKGDRNLVSSLIAEAKEARKTLFFPIFYEDRMPRDRKAAGNYILVETKMCRALIILSKRRDEIVEIGRQIEHMLTRPLAAKLLDAYPTDANINRIVTSLRNWWTMQFKVATTAFGKNLPKDFYDRVAHGYSISEMIANPATNEREQKITRTLGLIDFYFNSIEGVPWITETRRKIGIQWLQSVYLRRNSPTIGDDGFTQSVGDGVPNFILDDILNAEEELFLTGMKVFVNLNAYAEAKLRGQKHMIPVHTVNGDVFHRSNGRILSSTPDPTIMDGSYMMSPKGVITVYESDPELHSDFKAKQALVDPDAFEEDAPASPAVVVAEKVVTESVLALLGAALNKSAC